MRLTKEEKRRIKEEEKYRRQVRERKKIVEFFQGLLILVVIIVGAYYWFVLRDDGADGEITSVDGLAVPKKKPETPTEKALRAYAQRREAADCRATLQCWGDKHLLRAGTRCKDLVERRARYSHEWTDGFLETKFSHFKWRDRTSGVVTYMGDKIRFQNGFGAWQNMVYECDYLPSANSVLAVRVNPGRL